MRTAFGNEFLGRRLDAPSEDAQFPPEQTFDLVRPARPAARRQLLFLEALVEDALGLLGDAAPCGARQAAAHDGIRQAVGAAAQAEVLGDDDGLRARGRDLHREMVGVHLVRHAEADRLLARSLLDLCGIDLDLLGSLLQELGQIGAAGELELAEGELDLGRLVADRRARGADERLDGVGDSASVPGPKRVVAFLSPLPTVIDDAVAEDRLGLLAGADAR